MSSDNQMSSDNGLNTKKVNSPSENSSPEEHGAGFVSRALFWTISTRYGGKFINLITTIILAWLLSKEDFGLAGYALIFVAFIEILEGFGVESALVYHKEDKDLLDNAFWISAFTGLLIALGVYLCAPIAALIFDDERAIPLVQVLALAFAITGLRIVPKALLTRRMQFKRMVVPELAKVCLKGLAAVTLAFYGAGAWSLIISVVIGLAAELCVLWWLVDWRPSLRFVTQSDKIRPLLSYGGGMLGLSVVGTLAANVDYVLVGRVLGASALGVYMIGFRLPAMLIMPIIAALSKVFFPLSVHKQNDPAAMVDGWKKALRYLSMVSIPVGLGIASVAGALVPALFGEKWVDAVPVVSGIAIQTVLISLVWHIGDIYKATGRIRLLFWLGVVHLLITLPLLYGAVHYFASVGAVAYAHVISAALMVFIRFRVVSHVMQVPMREILSSILQPMLAGLGMYIAVFLLDQYVTANIAALWPRLAINIGVGVLSYLALIYLLMRNEMATLFQQVRVGLVR